jgi:hypothetical protein
VPYVPAMTAPWTFEELVEIARADKRVVGLVLTGSRGHGQFIRDDSDWDVRLVVRDEAVGACRSAFGTPRGSDVEVVVLALAAFEEAGAIDSESAWDRYSCVRGRVVLDKLDGLIAELVAARSVIPAAAARGIAAERLDDYVNSYYRSAKNHRSGLVLESRLDAAESVPPLLDALFALHERVRPFNKLLRWELETEPLGGERWAADVLLPRLQRASMGDIQAQESLFRDVEALARARGHGDVIDAWEPDVAWLRG